MRQNKSIRAAQLGRWLGCVAFGAGALLAAPVLTAPAAARAVASAKGPTWPRPTTSDQVTALQYLLRAHGFPVVADGKLGARTRRQVVKFQRSRRLKADGVVGSRTWQALIVPLKEGDSGDAVRGLQTLLGTYVGSGEYTVQTTGTFDSDTAHGLRDFQDEFKIGTDGLAGAMTWRRLLAENSKYPEVQA